MLPNVNNSYFIVAIDDQTIRGRSEFESWLRNLGIGFKNLLGKFQGRNEYSYIINVANWPLINKGGHVTNQTHALYLAPQSDGMAKYGIDARPATLYDLRTGETEFKGLLVPIYPDELDQYPDWSFDISDDQYYATRKIGE